MSMYSYCIFMYLHRASWHPLATLTEGFPCFLLSCKAKCQGITRKDGAQPALFQNFCVVLYTVCFVSCALFMRKCVLYCTVLLPPGGYPIAVNKYIMKIHWAVIPYKGKLILFCDIHFFNWINQPDAANSQVYYLSFRYSSTCFRHPHAHHQKLQQLQ
jgi:hypothetical protein